MPVDLNQVPEGAWLHRDGDMVVIGAMLRDALVFNWIFAFFWSFSMLLVPNALMTGDWWAFLFGSVFFVFGLYLWKNALMAAFGHVEVRLGEQTGTVFYGIRKWGKTKTFDYKNTHQIEEYVFAKHNGVPQYAIKIEGKNDIKFGAYMKEEHRTFMMHMLRTFMVEGDKVRDALPVDLTAHLID